MNSVRGAQMLMQMLDQFRTGVLLSPWFIGPLILVLWVVVLLALKKRILALSRYYLAHRTSWVWAEALIDATSPALTVAIVAGGIALLDRILPLSSRSDRAFGVLLTATLILALAIFADRICRRLVSHLAFKSQ